MRCVVLLCALLGCVLPQGVCASQAAPEPLVVGGSQALAAQHALIALAQGRVDALEALPLAVFTAPIGRADADDATLIRRWTYDLRPALDRMPAADTARLHDRLDALAELLARSTPGVGVLLPSASAARALRREADRCFDRGRFADYLTLWALCGRPEDGGRAGIAERLLHGSERALPMPGPLHVSTAMPRHRACAAIVAVPGWLLGLDPWGRVLWQRRIAGDERCTCSDDLAVIEGPAGSRLVARDGTQHALPPLPAAARRLGVADGAVWYAIGSRAWRVDGRSSSRTVQLDEEPLAAPLARDGQSLWLGRTRVMLAEGATICARFAHGLPAQSLTGGAAQLAYDRDGGVLVVVRGEHGRTGIWAVSDLAVALTAASDGARAALLLAADRIDEATAAASSADLPPLLAARLGIAGGEQPLPRKDAASQALLAAAQLRALPSARRGETESASYAAAYATLAAALADPDAEAVSLWTEDRLSDPPPAWRHTLRHLGPLQAAYPPHARGVVALPLPAQVGRVTPAQLFSLRRIGDSLIVSAHRDRSMAWSFALPALPPLTAPSCQIEAHGAWVLIAEGEARITVIDASTGLPFAWFPTADLGFDIARCAVLSDPPRLAGLGPVGIDTRLSVIDSYGALTSYSLPSPARSVLALGARALVVLRDGSALTLPDAAPFTLPGSMRRSDLRSTPEGLVQDERCYPFAR